MFDTYVTRPSTHTVEQVTKKVEHKYASTTDDAMKLQEMEEWAFSKVIKQLTGTIPNVDIEFKVFVIQRNPIMVENEVFLVFKHNNKEFKEKLNVSDVKDVGAQEFIKEIYDKMGNAIAHTFISEFGEKTIMKFLHGEG